ncbi:protein translocase subunit SecD [Caldalkalibacillus mannanilyticus]|uniref:protein translocase subunit SecD n=1 Tax=Caldalkalibacillus mannanilyticus TaxID=1418 RepID=UPI0009DE281A|nr:protein translocase subunit SecD [Caldalkalibacillus mannanilyticus]
MTKWSRIIIFLLIVLLTFAAIGGTVMDVARGITLGLDLKGGFEILYQVVPKDGQEVTSELISHTVAALDRRVNVIGVSEPDIRPEGTDRVRVKLAGIDNPDDARRLLSTEAHLTFRDAEDNELLSGEDLKEGSSRVVYDPNTNLPMVEMHFKDPNKVREITTEVLGQPMVIWMDFEEGVDSYEVEKMKELTGQEPKYISAPVVRAVLSNSGVIDSAYWDFNEAKELSDLLNAGALPVELVEMQARSVGAKLGENAMNKTIFAGYVGCTLIILYMLFYYRIPGVVAAVTIIAYIYLILLVFDWMNATLTLPGIAALVLGVGMAVDANIITYERIKDELRSGKTLMSAFRAGSRRALGTIMDANITTILAAGVLFYFGSSAIQGFAVMLILSILLSILTAVFGARLLLSLLVSSRAFDRKPRWFGVKESEIREL